MQSSMQHTPVATHPQQIGANPNVVQQHDNQQLQLLQQQNHHPMQFQPGNTTPLSMLLSWACHRTYAELKRMENLNPNRSDKDKKITLVKFADQTKKLFVRILAVLKWTKSADQVLRSNMICTFLEDQVCAFALAIFLLLTCF